MLRRTCILILLALGACYRPNLASESFYCHANDNPACPDGQSCVSGRCVSPRDGGGEDGAMDLSSAASQDLSMPGSTPDMSKTHDMASGGCVGTGGDCTYHNNSVCCSNYCVYSSNTCK